MPIAQRVRRMASVGAIAGVLLAARAFADVPDAELETALRAVVHDVFGAGFIALALVVVWLLVVVPSNAVVRRIRLAPLGR